MTPLEDKLRAALRDTAHEIPADPPPLILTAHQPAFRLAGRGARPGRRGWIAWAAPLATATLVLAVIATSVTLTRSAHRPRATNPAGPALDGIPPYYVALTTVKPNTNMGYGAVAAEVRSTATGAVIVRIPVPKPYVAFTAVTAASDDRTFVLLAQEGLPGTLEEYAPARFFLLRIFPDTPVHHVNAYLDALPARFIPAGNEVNDMAMSPDGTALAADIGRQLDGDQLYMFNLATGAERTWSARTCASCLPSSGGLGFVSVNVDALSWTADRQHIAFVWGGAIRLLNTSDPGSNLLTNSRRVAVWTAEPSSGLLPMLRGAIITPNGRTAFMVEELAHGGPHFTLREHLVKFSTATGQATAILNDLNVLALNGYEQVLYTNATGSVLVVTFTRPGRNAMILHDGRYTPIPWSPYIGVAAW